MQETRAMDLVSMDYRGGGSRSRSSVSPGFVISPFQSPSLFPSLSPYSYSYSYASVLTTQYAKPSLSSSSSCSFLSTGIAGTSRRTATAPHLPIVAVVSSSSKHAKHPQHPQHPQHPHQRSTLNKRKRSKTERWYMNARKANAVPGQLQQDTVDVAAVIVEVHGTDTKPKAVPPSMVEEGNSREAEWASVLPEQRLVQNQNPNPSSTPNPNCTGNPSPANSWLTSLNVSYFLPRVLALSVAATWGTNFPTVKYLQESLNGLDSPTAATIRFGLAGLALTPVLIDFGKGKIKELPQLVWVDGLLAGLATFAGYLCQSVALDHIGAGKAAFLCSLNVIVVPLMKRLWDAIYPGNNSFTSSDTEHEHVKSPGESNPWLPAMLAVAGVGVLELLGHNGVSASFGWDELEWDLVAFGQAVGFGVGYLINEHAVKKEPKYVMDFTAVQLIVIAVCAGTWAIGNNMAIVGPDASVWQGAATLSAAFGNLVSPPFDWKTIGAIGYTGLISTAFMIWLSNKVLNDLTASEFSVLISSEPLFASTFAFLLLKEPIGINLIAGGALIISACLLEVIGFEKIKRVFWPKKLNQKQH